MPEREFSDYYAALKVEPDATFGQIRRAYLQMALLLHPDRAGEAGTEAFMFIRRAYETLSDANLRQAYDARREAFERKAGELPANHDLRFVASRIKRRKWWEDPLKSRSVSLLTKKGKCKLCCGSGVIEPKAGPARTCWMCMGTGKTNRPANPP